MSKSTLSDKRSDNAGFTERRFPVRWIGAAAAGASAVGYTCANVFLRAVHDVDPTWVTAFKATWTVLIFAPWLIFLATQRKKIAPSWRAMSIMWLAAIVGQLGGNLAFQWSLGIIGLAALLPLTTGSLLIAGAVMGRLWLAQPVRYSTAIGIAIMIVALVVVSQGTSPETGNAMAAERNSGPVTTVQIVLATAGGVLTGVAYAFLAIGIRRCVTEGVSLATPMVITGITGAIVLGSVAWSKIGWQGMMEVSTVQAVWMTLAGVANAVAFLALTKAIQSIPVVYVNLINASQVAMAACVGVVLFGEQMNPTLGLGIGLTILGFVFLTVYRLRQPGK